MGTLLALYKGNKDNQQAKPLARRSALVRSRLDFEQDPPPFAAPSEEVGSGGQLGQQDASDLDPQDPPQQALEPGEQDVDPPLNEYLRPPLASESALEGRVLGRTKAQVARPDHLPAYKQTVVIGGDPKREEPPPPQPTSVQGASAMEQTMAAPQAPPPPQIDKEILEKAQQEAQQLLHQAQLQAQQISQQAMAQAAEAAEAARQEAMQQGYQEGLQAGQQAGLEHSAAEAQNRLDLLKTEFVQLVKARRKVLAEMEPELIKLSIGIAERILAQELAINKEAVVAIVREGIATLKEREEITVRVHPSEVELLTPYQTELEAMVEGLKRFFIQGDGSIEPGSCAIETNLGNVDARLSTRLEAVRLGLEEISKIRSFERKDKLELQPVEVPGEPGFEDRMSAEAEQSQAHEVDDHHPPHGEHAPPDVPGEGHHADEQGQELVDPSQVQAPGEDV